MSNKIALATIQFRADVKGANPALDSLRESSKRAHDQMNQLQEAFDKGIKTMKDANGVDFDVEKRLKAVTKEAKNFDRAINELVKGATALEEVVKNIRMGEIEKSSRAELKGAINAAKARERSIREMSPDGKLNDEDLKHQRELNQVIAESEKQLLRLDHDTAHVIETIQNGETVAKSALDSEIKGLRELLNMIPKGTEEWNKYNDQLTTIETHIANVRKQEREAASALLGEKDFGQYSEEQIRTAITNAKELLATYKSASPEAKALADNIVRAEQYLKEYGVEAARAAAREQQQLQAEKDLATVMNKRLRDLKSLSADALAETRRYWEAQRNGAAEGTKEFTRAENALKKIDNLQKKQKVAQLDAILGDPSKFGIAEVRNAVQEMEKLRDSVQKNTPAWLHFNKMVEQGKTYLDNLAKTEAAERINTQMQKLSTLSAAGLQEVKRYWETMVAGAERGSTELAQYEAKLKQVTAEEQARAAAATKQSARGIFSLNYNNMSEGELRKAIEAAKEYQKTIAMGDPVFEQYSRNIVRAENYLREYGLEAERAADKQNQLDYAMRQQLQDGSALSQSALKAQEQYWQRLIDDPKTAAGSLATYKSTLDEVHRLQAAMVQDKGQAALSFFRSGTGDASAAEIKQQAAALKAYRDSLPQQSNATLIQEIDGYIAQTGKTAQKATEEMMSMSKAMGMAVNAGKSERSLTDADRTEREIILEEKKHLQEFMKDVPRASSLWDQLNKELEEYNAQLRKFPFSGTTEELKKAQETLEQAMATAEKGSPKYERLRMALARIKAELAGAGISAQKTHEILQNPKAEKNVDNLRNAVAKARGELDVMAQRQGRMQRILNEIGNTPGRERTAARLKQAIKENTKAYDELAAATKRADQAQKELANTSKGAVSSFDKAWSRLKTYISLYVGAAVAMQKISSTMGDLMELSDKMGEVRKTTGFTADEVGRLSVNLKKIDTRTTLNGLMDLSVAAGQLGLKTQEDVLGFTEAANKLMVALPEMGREGATQMLKVALATGEIDKIRKQMEQGLIEGSSATAVAMEKVGSTIDRLRATSAATAPAITDFVKRVGAVGAQSGISIDQVAALGSTVDALGMRVEMSATALSRMIPAIKNNAFDLAHVIGVTPEVLRSLFDAGRGMEAILMILQHIKDSGMDADSIESMLGMGNMKEIMKELNQQGARAGIVFAGLSQNVDELRRQLNTASIAYEENTAIQQEYDKMNETTAAKWERLKNQVEESLVTDTAQRWMGRIIDGLRKIVDLLVGNGGLSTALYTIITLWGLIKVGFGETLWKAIAAGISKTIDLIKNWQTALQLLILKMREMSAAQWANVLVAAGAAIGMLIYKLIQAKNHISIVSKEMAELEGKVRSETKVVNELFYAVNKTNTVLSEARKKLEEARKAGEDAAKAEEQLKKANVNHAATIREINSKYGQYLGYMLSETANALQLAKARDLINAKLRETITLKQKEAALGNVEREYGGNVNKKAANTEELVREIFGNNYEAAARVSIGISEAAEKYAKDAEGFNKAVKVIITANKKFISSSAIKDLSDAAAQGGRKISDKDIVNTIAGNVAQRAEGYRKATEEYMKQEEAVNNRFDARLNVAQKKSKNAVLNAMNQTLADHRELLDKFDKAEGEEKKTLAVEIYKHQRSYNNLYANNAAYFENDGNKGVIEKNIKNLSSYEKRLRSVAGQAIKAIDAMERAETNITGTDYTNGGESSNNPWGGKLSAESTDYANMNAKQLVNRRKQMAAFVNAIQTDTDVQSVLAEDKALKAAIEKGMSSDMRTVIEWYNTERLKIQEELKERNLTNEGNWRDPKTDRSRRSRTPMSDAALAELERYYAWRKQMIEESRIEEGLTEEEFNRRADALEEEHLKKRSDLRNSFTSEDKVFVQQFQKWWASVEELDEVEWDGIAAEWRVARDREIKRNNANAAKDLAQMRMITVKHLDAIADILAKERPYDGITKNLQDNLTKMGILFADFDAMNRAALERGEKDPVVDASKYVEQNARRVSFLLHEAENAYSTTVEELLTRMREQGFGNWANEISKDDRLKNALMAQLRTAYDAIQEAIKKEASLMKKQAEIQWNNILLPDGKTTIKQAFERTLSTLGLKEDQVKRANSLIGAGRASERVADKLAIKQMQVQLDMQEQYFALLQKIGRERIAQLEKAGKYEDAEHLRKSLNLALTEEQKKKDEQRVAIANQLEESQNRLYQDMREWADLFASSTREMFEASNAGSAEYYNEMAKMRLTGKGGPGAGTYIVIDNEGTENASAHYEYLSEREALERQREIEQQNAVADAFRKVMDDINQKMSESITDWMNAYLQNQSIDMNTEATNLNTAAIAALTATMAGQASGDMGVGADGVPNALRLPEEESAETPLYKAPWQMTPDDIERSNENMQGIYQGMIDASNSATDQVLANQGKIQQGETKTDKTIAASSQSAFAKMTQAANLYGIAYQAMANDNLSAAQKFEIIALQAIGNGAIAALTTSMAQSEGEAATKTPVIFGKAVESLGPIAGPIVFGALTALLGGLMGMAVSKVASSKSQIAQITGASVGAGRLSTGMLTYAEGNVNEFTDPSTLTPGRKYNVDAADGRTYKARYMGKNARTHITSGPEFHLVGEKGREAIIDAHTTRQLQMDDNGIWQKIQTLYNGGRISRATSRRGRGVRAFADGNMDDFTEVGSTLGAGGAGMDASQLVSLQASIDRQSDLLEELRTNGIKATFDVYGKGGLVDSYDKGKKNVSSHGEKY